MKTTKKEEYPMHEKLKALGHDRVAVQNFIDWLFDTKDWWIAEYGDERGTRAEMFPIRTKREDIMADFFGIDLKIIEAEKRAMLDHFREQQKRREEASS